MPYTLWNSNQSHISKNWQRETGKGTCATCGNQLDTGSVQTPPLCVTAAHITHYLTNHMQTPPATVK